MATTNTVALHRVLRCPPERVYSAFTTPAAFAKWLPPHGFYATVHEADVKVGGSYRMSFTNLTTGNGHSFGGRYLELEPGRRLRYTARFDDPNLPGEMTTTVELKAVFCGTEMHIRQEGIPAVIPAEACYMGWQESLLLLAQLAEPEINQ
ncbi:SRPBCC family protein [Roseateles sp.]|uniref:SRPBCC family protein n=1 Tax=Roseateles sp. TaxID=1971397 RepID=UPI0039E8A834